MKGPRLASALLVAASLLPLPMGPQRAEAAPHLVRKLGNKMTVVVRENRTRPLVAIQAWVLSGTRDEAKNERGAATALSKTMLMATKRREPGVIETDLAGIGATFVSDVGYAHMSFGMTVPARSFGAGLDILSDIVMRPRFDAKDVEQGIAGSRLESRGRLSATEAPSLDAVRRALHPDSPLGYPRAVPDGQLAALNAGTIHGFYKKHVVAENVLVVVVGNVDPEDAARQVENAFRDLSGGRAPAHPRVSEKAMSGLKVVSEPSPSFTPGSALTVGFRGPAWNTADAIALDVLMAALADGPASRVQRRLQATGEFVGAGSGSMYGPEGGTVAISVRVRPDQLRDAENALLAEIAQARSTPINPAEMDAAVRHVLGRDLSAASELGGLARATALSVLMGKPGMDEVYFERIKAVKSEDLLAVANKYLDWKQAAVVETAPAVLVDSLRLWNDYEKRIRERVQMHQAAYGAAPASAVSKDVERAARIDAPLKSIPTAPFDAGRGRVEKVASSSSADFGDIRVLASEDRSAPMVTLGVYSLGGVRYENDNNNGVTALMREALLSSQDSKAEGLTYHESLDALGSLVQYHDRDLWGLSLAVPAEDWKYALDRLGAMFSASRLDTTAVDAARLTLIDELNRWLQDEDAQRAHLLFDTKYVISGYRLPALGNRKNILTLANEDIDAWYQKFVVRSNVVVTVFGDMHSAEVGPAVAEAFRGLSSGAFRPGTVAQEGDFEGFREKWELGAGPVSTVSLAFNGPRGSSPEVPLLYVVNSVLSGPKGWFKEYMLSQPSIVEARSYVAQSIDESPIVATLTTNAPAQEETAVNLLFRQFKKIAFYPLDGDEAPTLKRAKVHAVSTMLARLRSNTARSLDYGRYEVMGLGSDYLSVLPAKMEAASADDLIRFGRKYFEIDEFKKQAYSISETRPGGW